jgi:hypothetical protein
MYYQDGDILINLRDGSGYVNHSSNYNSECILNK